jgi:DNA invertase Pin-like site-specific DNA recombinase
MRAAVYCRFSSDQQKPTSLADQERICRQYIEQQGWTTVEVYSGWGTAPMK